MREYLPNLHESHLPQKRFDIALAAQAEPDRPLFWLNFEREAEERATEPFVADKGRDGLEQVCLVRQAQSVACGKLSHLLDRAQDALNLLSMAGPHLGGNCLRIAGENGFGLLCCHFACVFSFSKIGILIPQSVASGRRQI